ncbi:MAG: PAS domain S-box protein, partial [Verrucomicrobia bacterium]|nr:PAS domain S-box protein [Prolixibacteraceae bacterium]
SVDDDPQHRMQVFNTGVEGVLREPIDFIELLVVIRAMLMIKVGNTDKRNVNILNSKIESENMRISEQNNIQTLKLLDNLSLENQVRKKTEELLYKSEENYRNLFEANPHPMWIFDQESLLFLEVNDMAIHHYGFSREEFLNMSINDIRPKEDIAGLLESVKVASSGQRNVGTWRHRKKNKRLIWVEVTAHPIDWYGKKAIVVLAHDITERKQAEEYLKTALQQLEFHEFNSPLAVIEFNNKYQITKWSNNAIVLFGWSAEEVLGKNIDELRWVHEDDVDRVASLSAKMVASQRTSNCHTNKNYRKDGSVITCEWYNSAMIDAHGKLVSVNSLVLDITERELAEKSLHESHEFNQSLLHAIPFGMHIVDENGEILFVNEILGKRIGTDAIGKKCWTLYRDSATRCIQCPLSAGITVGEASISESYNIFGGRVSQISHNAMLFKGKKAMLEIFQDITERKQIETELIIAKDKAEESDQLKTSFLANMSHEIRTPLNSIIGFSELLTDPDYDPSQQYHIARMIYFSGNNLLSIINNLLEISKIEAGQVQIDKKPFLVNKLVNDLQKEYLFKSIEKGIELMVDSFNPVEEVYIISDEVIVRKILLNFLSNAIKFTRQGSIKLGFQVHKNVIEFSVKDTGIGIPSEFHDKIFEHFRQVEDANTRKYGGNGLGLSISKGLVNTLGGEIWMESEKGKGSTFYFSVPI